MDDFGFYINLGKNHILDVNGYDHILFVVCLCLVYSFKDWKKVAWLITAFTLGHSFTLALATLKIVVINTSFVEFLIPITILLTAIINIFNTLSGDKNFGSGVQRYFLASIFGLIHGLGFSNFLRSILGKEENILFPLCYFNIGLELGQLVIVLLSLSISYISIKLVHIKSTIWIQLISSVITLISLMLIWKNWIF